MEDMNLNPNPGQHLENVLDQQLLDKFNEYVNEYELNNSKAFAELSDNEKVLIAKNIQQARTDFLSVIGKYLDDPSKEYLLSLHGDDIFNFTRLTHSVRFDKAFDGSDNKILAINKVLLYYKTRGYGHPDVLEREVVNPVPTIEELKMGCFIEQIEVQSRQAVIALRRKGYETQQSGFHDIGKWSQYFDVVGGVPPNILEFVESYKDYFLEKYNVLIYINNRSDRYYIELEPKDQEQYLDILKWVPVFNDLVDKIPKQKDFVGFSAKGDTFSFIQETVKGIPKEKMLEQCKNQNEIDLIESLYGAKNRAEIAEIIGYKDD